MAKLHPVIVLGPLGNCSPIDHPATKLLPVVSRGKFTFSHKIFSVAGRHLHIQVTQSTCLPLTCYHALVRHACRPGRTRWEWADWSRKACSSPSAFPCRRSVVLFFLHHSVRRATRSLDRHVQGKLFACRVDLVMGATD